MRTGSGGDHTSGAVRRCSERSNQTKPNVLRASPVPAVLRQAGPEPSETVLRANAHVGL